MADDAIKDVAAELTKLPPPMVTKIWHIALVSIACTLVTLFGLFITIIDADFIDNKLHVSQRVSEKLSVELVRKVDSGYSRVFIFRPDDPFVDNSLLFHAEEDQQVSFDVSSATSDPESVYLRIFRDNKLWTEGDGTLHTTARNVTSLTCEGVNGCIHTARVVAVKLPKGHPPVVIRFLVLVSNKPVVRANK